MIDRLWPITAALALASAVHAGLLTFAAREAFAQVSAADGTLSKYDSRNYEYRDIEKGGRFEICRAYWAGIKERQVPYRYCGIAIPSNNPDFRLPRWETIDPTQHMDLVREIFYWSNVDQHQIGQHDYFGRQGPELSILPELLEKIWGPARADVERLVAEGQVKLQRSSIDIDFDGKRDTVYRMTPVYRPFLFTGEPRSTRASGIEYQPTKVDDRRQCQTTDLLGAGDYFVYYVRPEDSPNAHLTLRLHHLMPDLKLFYWRNRAYWLWDDVIHEPVTWRSQGESSGFSIRDICYYRARRIGEPD